MPRVSWRELRHIHATLLNAQGESVKTIQAQLRHSSVRVTMEIYTHAIPQQQQQQQRGALGAAFWTQMDPNSGERRRGRFANQLILLGEIGGADGVRTRDLLRDRQAF